jgi:hypothetical protein
MDISAVTSRLRTFWGSLNRVVRWLLWGAIALVGTSVALMVALVAATLLRDLPSGGSLADPRTEALRGRTEALRGIRAVHMLVILNKDAERCGIGRDEVTAVAKSALGPSFRITEPLADADGALKYWVHGASATEGCVLLLQWSLDGKVLSWKDRRDAFATIDSNTTMLEFPRHDAAHGKKVVLRFVELEMRDLRSRWSKVNTSP